MLRKRSLWSGRRVGAGMLAQSQRESRKLGWVGNMCVWWVPLIFLVTGQCTPDDFVLLLFFFFFSFEYRSPWCYNLFFFFFLKNLKEAFLRIKWPSPRLRSQGRWVYYRIALDTPLGDHAYQGEAVRGQRGRNLALLERQCGVAFPRLPPQCPGLGTPRLQGLRRTPLLPGESVCTTWEG